MIERVIHDVASIHSLLYLLAGTVAGYLVGALPGIGPVTGIALLLPLTAYLGPTNALLFYTSLYQAAEYGGSITAIAVSTPGAPNSAALIPDGYAMNRSGRIGKAFAYSLWTTIFASLVGIAGMLLLSRPLAQAALALSPADYAALGVLGLATVGTLTVASPLKGLIAAAFGLALSTVGLDQISGVSRFTFNQPTLYDGLPLVAVIIGTFAMPEAIEMLIGREAHIAQRSLRIFQPVWLRMSEFIEVFRPAVLGTAVGFLMGLIPGLAGSVPPWISYNLARAISRNPAAFGTGTPEGIVAPEGANAASMHSTLIPTFALGIPGTPTSAVILGAMTISGLTAGPLLFQQHPEVPYTVFIGLLIATLFLWVLGLVTTSLWAQIVRLPRGLLGILIVVFTITGSFASRNNLLDVAVAMGIGILCYGLRRAGFPLPAIILGLILGPIIEVNLRRALLLSKSNPIVFFGEPISAILLLCAAFVVAIAIFQTRATVRRR